MEIESLESTIEENLFKVYDETIPADQGEEAKDKCGFFQKLKAGSLLKRLQLEIFPEQETKAKIVFVRGEEGNQKACVYNYQIELLPPVEIEIILPESYPEKSAPLFKFTT